MYRVLAVFAFTPIFWALWDQNLSEWVLQATRLDLTTGRRLFNILPEQINFINPFLFGVVDSGFYLFSLPLS